MNWDCFHEHVLHIIFAWPERQRGVGRMQTSPMPDCQEGAQGILLQSSLQTDCQEGWGCQEGAQGDQEGREIYEIKDSSKHPEFMGIIAILDDSQIFSAMAMAMTIYGTLCVLVFEGVPYFTVTIPH